MIINKISEEIKKTLNGFDERKMYHQMEKHYKIMHLMDKDGKWRTPELQKLSENLLPNNLTEEKSKEFVDIIAKIAQQNPYLMSFLEKAEHEDFSRLTDKVNNEGWKVLPDVVAYSLVLDRITNAVYNEPKILEDCISIFKKDRSIPNESEYASFFHKIKLLSVEKPIVSLFLKSLKNGYVPKNGGKYIVALNILEAVIDDYISDLKSNARAGLTLFNNKSESNQYNPLTGARPTSISNDGKSIKISMPLPKKWADLYQTWNLAFCSKFEDFPYYFPKLLIPEVSNYKKEPTKYMYKRALALYIVLNYAGFNYAEQEKRKEDTMDWRDENLTRLWGECNEQSAKNYESALVKRQRDYFLDSVTAKNSSKPTNTQNEKPDLKSEARCLKDIMLNKQQKNNLDVHLMRR